MAQKDKATKIAAGLRRFGIKPEDVRRALGEPAHPEPWYTQVAKITSSEKLWGIVEQEIWEIGSPEEQVILLKILYNTKRMDWRWTVFEYANDRKLRETAELALMEILRLAKTEDDLEGVLYHSRKYEAVLHAALRDLISGRKRHSATRRRVERKKSHLRILSDQAVG
jgi:hypothetical protein